MREQRMGEGWAAAKDKVIIIAALSFFAYTFYRAFKDGTNNGTMRIPRDFDWAFPNVSPS